MFLKSPLFWLGVFAMAIGYFGLLIGCGAPIGWRWRLGTLAVGIGSIALAFRLIHLAMSGD